MPRTPDRFPGSREEEAIILENRVTDPATPGEIRYVNNHFRFNEGGTVIGLGLSGHRLIDELTHDLDESCYVRYTYVGNRLVNVTVWTDSSQTLKIREYQITYSGLLISQLVEIQYDNAGNEVERLTHSFEYQGKWLIADNIVRS